MTTSPIRKLDTTRTIFWYSIRETDPIIQWQSQLKKYFSIRESVTTMRYSSSGPTTSFKTADEQERYVFCRVPREKLDEEIRKLQEVDENVGRSTIMKVIDYEAGIAGLRLRCRRD